MLRTIKEDAETLIEIKKSKFYGYTFFCENVEDANKKLKELKTIHKKATHVCFAYVINSKEKASDDGEPKGTAGVPILEIIKKNKITNVVCVVVRYFGGVKLGAGGLLRAYTDCATNAIKQSGYANLKKQTNYSIKLNYSEENILNELRKNLNIVNLKVEYSDFIRAQFGVLDDVDLNKIKSYNLELLGTNLIRI